MREKAKKQVESYVKSVAGLFSEVESWIATKNLRARHLEIEINEESAGVYKIDSLRLETVEGKEIADLTPVGAFVIGANGRIDLNGNIDKVIIVNLVKTGPALRSSVTTANQTATSSRSFYKGIEKSGWYWIEDKLRGKAHYGSRRK